MNGGEDEGGGGRRIARIEGAYHQSPYINL